VVGRQISTSASADDCQGQLIPPAAVVGAICVVCRGDVSVLYELKGQYGGSYRLQKWLCPLCKSENTLNLSGRILDVTKSILI
jgi:hypothetical protein